MSLDKLFRFRELRGAIFMCWCFLVAGTCTSVNAQDPSVVGQWSAVQTWPIVAVHAHVLPTGKVLFYPYTDDPRLWDPATGAITSVAQAGYDIFCTGHAFLPDGRLLVSGGHIANNVGEPKASIYNPFNNTWTRLPDMNAGRWYPTNTTLANGDVLVVSGDQDTTAGVNPLPQVWQTASNSWRNLTNAQLNLYLYPSMHLAPNGKVFMSIPSEITRYLDTSGSGLWTTVAIRQYGFRSYGSAAMYDDGKVLVVGGGDPPTNTAEVIDLNAPSPAWRFVGSMSNARRQFDATLLPDGKVLVTGGSSGPGFDNSSTPVYAAEMWDPATEQWTTMASNTVYHGYHSNALLLPDGRVLTTGGDNQLNAEIYSPPYLFKGTRPAISSAPASVVYGQTFFVETPNAASITKVTGIRLPSVTHAFDQNQRINRLSFSQATGGLNVTAPSNANLCPPGHYMLFILDGNGVPSVAKIIAINAGALPLPAAPSNLSATTVSAGQIDLKWSDNASNEDGFKIERCQGSGCTNFAEITQVGAGVVSYSNTGLASSTSYSYRVRAFNLNGNSDYSNTASATTSAGTPAPGPPAAPTNLISVAVSQTRIDLSWTDSSANEDGFQIERSTDGRTFTQIATVGANVTTYSNTGLTCSTFYYYRVRAFNANGNSAYTNTAKRRTQKCK
jgi:galactose oxidase-like protein/glyoxal oxidase-like protein/fibronectin type III domain protein/Kelch motif protein